MKVDFRKSFEKDLGRIRDQDLLGQIKAAIKSVEDAESLLDVGNIKKLKADGSYYRIRVGDYRIGLTRDEGLITFVRGCIVGRCIGISLEYRDERRSLLDFDRGWGER